MTRLRGGIIRRGTTWSYVVRVTDPYSGVSRPRWVGGFASEEAAKSARDEARRRGRRGEYVDRNSITVAEYLSHWLAAHSLEIKPKTLAGYRWLVNRYVVPRLGSMRMQTVRPSHLSVMYRDLLDGGGRDGRALSRRTVDAVHAVLRKAFNDAVVSEQILESNPVLRAKRPRSAKVEADPVWTPAELARFLEHAKTHRLYPFFHLAAFTRVVIHGSIRTPVEANSGTVPHSGRPS
jgi:integrase